MKNNDWKEHTICTIRKIKDLKHTSPLGMFCSPEEYIEQLIDFTKLIYPLNGVPLKTMILIAEMDKDFESFKNKMKDFCDVLLEEFDKYEH